ncbi:uncharacterized protein LOC143283364 isoform X2 [Babylonia areolata]|uniref:uncharacterized protein LOC143283364 isoform X2 n=1 Tax=Babylonia areolata TaxID=304850 RepID=UPI003FD438F9
MPRATRRSLADNASSRSRSRTPAKASKATAATVSPSPKAAGGKGKAEEMVVGTKRQARSTSRGKTEAAGPSPVAAVQTPTRGSRSRSRGAASEEKKTPVAIKRGREKAKPEEEEEDVKPKRARSRGQSEVKSPAIAAGQRKGRSPAKAAASTKSKAKSPAKAVVAASKPRAKAAVSAKGKAKSPARAATSRSVKSTAAVSTNSKAKSPAKATVSSKSKAAVSTKSRTKSPAKAAAVSRSPRTPAAKTVNRKKEEPKKSTPRRKTVATPPSGKSNSPRTPAAKPAKKSPRGKASATKSRSHLSQEAVEPQEEAESNTEEKITTETEKEEEDTKEEVSQSCRDDAEIKDDKEKDNGEINKGKDDDDDVEMEEETDDSQNKDDLADKNSQEEEAAKEKNASDGKEDSEKDAAKVKEGPFTAEKAAIPVEAESEQAKDLVVGASENTEVPMEDSPPKDESSLEQGKKTSEVESIQPTQSSAVKRKFEEVSEEVETEPSAKQARLNGTEPEADTAQPVKTVEASASGAKPEDDLLKDFVVVNKDEVPAADSAEVAASVPAEKEVAVPDTEVPMETEKEVGSSSSDPVFVVPLTQMEMIRACAYGNKNQMGEQGDVDDASSTAVEVGSLASSEISTRHLDVSDVLSAANSTDGDRAAETSIDDTETEKPSMDIKESDSIPPAGKLSAAVSSSDPGKEMEIEDDLSSTSNPADPNPASAAGDSDSGSASLNTSVSEPAAANSESQDTQSVSQSSSASQANSAPTQTSMPAPVETTVAHNPGPSASPARVSSKVVAALGTPDPAFLSAYSSSGILNRAYVPNPAVPADSVKPDNCFSLVSYNILAECNRVKADYSYTAEEFLCQDYRHSLLMKELQYLDGDVICLQEVNPDYFNTTLLPAMKGLGYDGLLMRRTKDAFDEGEATFFKTSVFEMESSKRVSLSEVAFQEVERAGVSSEVGAALKKYLDRADVVLITKLRCKATNRMVTVGNIHVVWDFSRCPDVQCVQVACAIREVVSMSGSEGAHVICGDFNSEWTTPAYQMALDGSLAPSSVSTLEGISNLDLENGAKSLVSHLRQAFEHPSTSLTSAYSTVTKSEPEITSLTSFMESAVDYQLYSANSLMPVGVLKTIDHAVVKATGGLPNRDFPSDHVSMKSVMTFCK